jgi:hypothetical protein
MYLREKLSDLRFAAAVSALQEAHKKLHLSETYSELHSHLVGWHPHPETWVDRNYWDLMAVRRALDTWVNEWDTLSRGQRYLILDSALMTVESYFGRDNENWARELLDREQRIPRHSREMAKRKRKLELETEMDGILRAWVPEGRIQEQVPQPARNNSDAGKQVEPLPC